MKFRIESKLNLKANTMDILITVWGLWISTSGKPGGKMRKKTKQKTKLHLTFINRTASLNN